MMLFMEGRRRFQRSRRRHPPIAQELGLEWGGGERDGQGMDVQGEGEGEAGRSGGGTYLRAGGGGPLGREAAMGEVACLVASLVRSRKEGLVRD